MAPVGPASGGGDLELTVPEGWVAVKPRISMIQAEFALPKVEGDENDGRLTVMRAGGTVEDNVKRWRGQFQELQANEVEEIDVAGTPVTLVDLSGTYNDQRGPMAPAEIRPGYRMLAAIISAGDGLLFLKAYGPAKTMEKHAADFRGFVESAVPASE